MIISLYNAIASHSTATYTAHHIRYNAYSFPIHRNVPNLHLNALFLKDIYMPAKVVLFDLFAQIGHSCLKLEPSRPSDKPFKNNLFSKWTSPFRLKTDFSFLLTITNCDLIDNHFESIFKINNTNIFKHVFKTKLHQNFYFKITRKSKYTVALTHNALLEEFE
jgi:hypothetical protein